MSPQAQLLLTGSIEVIIGVALAGFAYWTWKRRTAANDARNPGGGAIVDKEQKQNAQLVDELGRLILEHSRSVDVFEKFVQAAVAHPLSKEVVTKSVASQVQSMRDANHRFDERAEDKATEVSLAADKYPRVFGDVSVTFVDHRRRTNNFDQALETVPANSTFQQLQQSTSESLHSVLETRERLEQKLAAAQQLIEQQAARLKVAELDARIDPLTRLPNRRAFDEHVAAVQTMHERHGTAYSLLMLDIDNFKSINDANGHAAGDAVLQVLGKVLQTQSRLSDRAFRLGGEEFAIVLSATTLRQAEIVAERFRKRIETSIVQFEGRELRFTTSIGAAEIEEGQSSAELLERADEALYAAKHGGRNRVEIAPALNAPVDETAPEALVRANA